MDESLHSSTQELFEEVVNRGIAEGVTTQEGYVGLVDMVIEDHRMVGELHDDQNLEGYEDVLEARWPEYLERIKSGN